MALADYAAFEAAVEGPAQQLRLTKASLTTVAGRHYSLWTSAPNGGAAPTTAAVPTNGTTGALGQKDATVASLWPLSTEIAMVNGGYLLLVDRLSHQGGLSGTTTGAQTTNLPTAALTRYTSGVGVFLGLEIYTAIGATGTTVTASYTDDAGNTGQTTQATNIGNTGFNAAGRVIVLPLAVGDVGVRAVASVTLAASTATAGNFGVTLFKPLLAFPMSTQVMNMTYNGLLGMGGNIPEIVDGACLQWMVVANTTSTSVLLANIAIAEA